MPIKNNLIILNSPIATALSTLAAQTSAVLATVFGSGLQADFLCVDIQVSLSLNGTITQGESVNIGFANGASTVAEITSGLTSSESVDPFDPSAADDQGRQNIVIQKTLRALESRSPTINEFMKMPGRGIVFREDKGVVPFAINRSDNALTTGLSIVGQVTYFGKWLSG